MAATTAASETSEGPVLSVINKRLRALRKKHNRILQMENSVATGKTLNKEQEETLRSKSSIIAVIDELEKLRPPLATAVNEKVNEKLAVKDDNNCVKDLVSVIYFGNMFKTGLVSIMLEKAMHERACCLNYDCMPEAEDESIDAMNDLLSEKDLDLISMFTELLICRPVNSTLSHKDALWSCVEHAKLWIMNSDKQIVPESNATYAGLRSKLNKIMSSLYFTTEPVFRVEQAIAEHESYPVPVEEMVVPVNATMQVESPVVRHQEKEEEHANSQADKSNGIHDSSAKELHLEDLSEQHAEPEEVGHEGVVEDLKDAIFDNQQSVSWKSHQNYRGNRGGGGRGRRGYSNGHGGRGRGRFYYDDHSYFDQPGNYYPRNYPNYRGRGGRGSRGGENYSHYASGHQAGNVSAVS